MSVPANHFNRLVLNNIYLVILCIHGFEWDLKKALHQRNICECTCGYDRIVMTLVIGSVYLRHSLSLCVYLPFLSQVSPVFVCLSLVILLSVLQYVAASALPHKKPKAEDTRMMIYFLHRI